MKSFRLFETPLSGINLVESSAGTGKTYAITGLYVRLIAEFGYQPSQIVVVTFTKAATQELRERIAKRLRESIKALENDTKPDDAFLKGLHDRFYGNTTALEHLRRAWTDVDTASIYTIHGFCQQALQEFVFESNSHFDVTYSGNDKELVTSAVDSVWREELRIAESQPWRKPLIDFLLESLKTPDELAKRMKIISGKPYIQFSVQSDADSMKNQCEALMKAYEAVRYHFYDEEEIRQLLLSGVLNKSSYKDESVAIMLGEARLFCEAKNCNPDISNFKNIHKLSSSFIQSRVTKGNTAPEHPFFDAVQKLLDFDSLNLVEGYYSELAQKINHQKDALKTSSRVRSFDDILIGMRDALADLRMVSAMQKNYPVALVDEFQDTDPIQLEIFERIYTNYENGCLFLIGDPKQSIYRFRGADIYSYIRARDNSAVQKYTLDKNYRSAAAMVQAANALFKMNSGENWPGDISFLPSDAHKGNDEFILSENESAAPIQFLVANKDDEFNKEDGVNRASEDTANEIARLLKAGQNGEIRICEQNVERPLVAGDIAVLVQRHAEADCVKQSLYKKGIKSVTKSNQSVFNSEECAFLLDLLAVIQNPGYVPVTRLILFSSFLGNPLSRLQKLESDATLFATYINHFDELKSINEKLGFMPMLRSFLERPIAFLNGNPSDVEMRLLSMDMAERRYTNLMHLAEIITKYERENSPGVEELQKWLQRMSEEPGMEETEIRLDSDDDLVQILTIHASKGLEFPVVFCPMLWSYGPRKKPEAPFIYHKNGHANVDFSGFNEVEARSAVKTDEMAEHIRLAYVAVTRARYRCYLSLIPYKQQQSKTDDSLGPISFLLADKEQKRDISEMNVANFSPYFATERASTLTELHPDLFYTTKVTTFEGRLTDSQQDEVYLESLHYLRTDTQKSSWFITSYSGLKKSASSEDHIDPEWLKIDHEVVKIQPSGGQYSIQNFPKGARSGIFMHKLFEEIPFIEFEKSGEFLTEKFLREDGFHPDFKPAILEMMRCVLGKPLPNSNARLITKNELECRKEMEFYFPLQNADADEIAAVISGKTSGFSDSLYGFMSGFIDLLFEHDGKWYILDYKSDTVDNYSPDSLKDIMEIRGYVYQYHIYLVALVRFLRSHLGEAFDYDKHIGGAYYLFLRGMNTHSDDGIYFARPSAELIHTLDSYFGGMK